MRKQKEPKKRIIYDGYSIIDDFDELKAEMEAELEEDEILSDDEVWKALYIRDELNWDSEKARLEKFFNEESDSWLLTGTLGLWYGNRSGGFEFSDFNELFNSRRITEDCDYIKIWDENGHLYISGTHHDGTNCYEIKALTHRGEDLLEKWKYDWDDPRTERDIHNICMNSNLFTRLPNFAQKIYGCPKTEYI